MLLASSSSSSCHWMLRRVASTAASTPRQRARLAIRNAGACSARSASPPTSLSSAASSPSSPCSAFSAPFSTSSSAAASPSASSSSSPSSSSASASSSSRRAPTAIVMLNMGGPATIPEVGPFLQRLFADGEIIQLGPLQSILGPFIAKRRTPRIEKQYAKIGGSPIRKWTELQARGVESALDRLSPSSAPHKAYAMFRYAAPLTEEVLEQMARDGVKRAVAFSQYPQYSCTTTGSSLNHLWRELKRLNQEQTFQWSLIDRWNLHPKFIAAVCERILHGLARFPTSEARAKAIIVFSAHSLPMLVVNRGDPYVTEVAGTVAAVMQRLREVHGVQNSHFLAWQSQVGFLPWMGPQTGEAIKGLGRQGHENLLLVPVAFTSDHVETLFELDIEYAHVAKEAGIKNYLRSESLNGSEATIDALTQIAADHLASGAACTTQYQLNCAHCVNPMCRSIVNPIVPYTKLRDLAKLSASV